MIIMILTLIKDPARIIIIIILMLTIKSDHNNN